MASLILFSLEDVLRHLQKKHLIRCEGNIIIMIEAVKVAIFSHMTTRERCESWTRSILMVNACAFGLTGQSLYANVSKLLDRWWLWSGQLDPPIVLCKLLLQAEE